MPTVDQKRRVQVRKMQDGFIIMMIGVVMIFATKWVGGQMIEGKITTSRLFVHIWACASVLSFITTGLGVMTILMAERRFYGFRKSGDPNGEEFQD